MKEKLTKAEFVEMFEIAWSSTCQSNFSYIEEVGAVQALQDEWDSMIDGLQEDNAFRRWKMTAAEKKKYMKEVEQYE